MKIKINLLFIVLFYHVITKLFVVQHFVDGFFDFLIEVRTYYGQYRVKISRLYTEN